VGQPVADALLGGQLGGTLRLQRDAAGIVTLEKADLAGAAISLTASARQEGDAITGKAPPSAFDRLLEDNYVPLAGQQFIGAGPTGRSGVTEQATEQDQVLPTGEVLVNRGVLTGQADPGADRGGLPDDVVSENPSAAAVRALESGEHPDRGGLAGAVRPQHPIHRPGGHGEIDAVHRARAAEHLDQTLRVNCQFRRCQPGLPERRCLPQAPYVPAPTISDRFSAGQRRPPIQPAINRQAIGTRSGRAAVGRVAKSARGQEPARAVLRRQLRVHR
jgi:hypothetical protein